MVYFGTDLKINVTFDVDNGLTMDDVDFECRFTCGSKRCTVPKSSMVRIDEHNYLALIRGTQTGRGTITCEVVVKVPDEHWEDGLRTEVDKCELNDVIK